MPRRRNTDPLQAGGLPPSAEPAASGLIDGDGLDGLVETFGESVSQAIVEAFRETGLIGIVQGPQPPGAAGIFADYLTPRQLADELGISERQLAQQARAGKGPPRTVVGRLIRYRRSAILTWLRALEHGNWTVAAGEHRRCAADRQRSRR